MAMRDNYPWGLWFTNYMYYVGLSAGGLVVYASVHLFGAEQFRPLSRLAVLQAGVLVMMALLGIVTDMERPWRAVWMLLTPNPTSPFVYTGSAANIYMIICFVDLWMLITGKGGEKLAHRDDAHRAAVRDLPAHHDGVRARAEQVPRAVELGGDGADLPDLGDRVGHRAADDLRLHHAALRASSKFKPSMFRSLSTLLATVIIIDLFLLVVEILVDLLADVGQAGPHASASTSSSPATYACGVPPVLVLGITRVRAARRAQDAPPARHPAHRRGRCTSSRSSSSATRSWRWASRSTRSASTRRRTSRASIEVLLALGILSLGAADHDARRQGAAARGARGRARRGVTATAAPRRPPPRARPRGGVSLRVSAREASAGRQGAQRPRHRRRRRRGRCVAVAVAVAVPLVATSTPEFFSRYHLLEPPLREPRGLGARGHRLPRRATRRSRSPNGVALIADFYTSLVTTETRCRRTSSSRRPRREACLAVPRGRLEHRRRRAPTRIPHPAHLRVASETRDCVDCHKWTAHLETYMDKHKKMPFSGVCVAYGCHVGTKTTEQCFDCHHVLHETADAVEDGAPAGRRRPPARTPASSRATRSSSASSATRPARRPKFTGLPDRGRHEGDREAARQAGLDAAATTAPRRSRTRQKCLLCHQSEGECDECHLQPPGVPRRDRRPGSAGTASSPKTWTTRAASRATRSRAATSATSSSRRWSRCRPRLRQVGRVVGARRSSCVVLSRAAGHLDAAARLLPALSRRSASAWTTGRPRRTRRSRACECHVEPGASGFLTFAARLDPGLLLAAAQRARATRTCSSAPSTRGVPEVPHELPAASRPAATCSSRTARTSRCSRWSASRATRTSCTRSNRRGFNRPEMERCLDAVPRRRQGEQRVPRLPHAQADARQPHAQADWLQVHGTGGQVRGLRRVPRLDAGLLRRLPREAPGLARRQLEEGPRTARQGARRRLPRLPRRREVLQGVPLMAERPRRRRLADRTASSCSRVLLLVVLPGFLATQPGFFGRVPTLAREVRDRGRRRRTPRRAAKRATCRPSVLAQAAYARAWSASSTSRSSPARGSRSVFGTPTNEACLACHNDLRTVSPKGDLQIPHRAHVTVLKMKCVECHNYLVHEKSPEGKHTPPMAGCLRCHDGDTAKNTCTACHTEKAAPASHRGRGLADRPRAEGDRPGVRQLPQVDRELVRRLPRPAPAVARGGLARQAR